MVRNCDPGAGVLGSSKLPTWVSAAGAGWPCPSQVLLHARYADPKDRQGWRRRAWLLGTPPPARPPRYGYVLHQRRGSLVHPWRGRHNGSPVEMGRAAEGSRKENPGSSGQWWQGVRGRHPVDG